jgi:hypothetical protein
VEAGVHAAACNALAGAVMPKKTLGSRKSRMIMRFFYIATVLRHVPAASSGLQ